MSAEEPCAPRQPPAGLDFSASLGMTIWALGITVAVSRPRKGAAVKAGLKPATTTRWSGELRRLRYLRGPAPLGSGSSPERREWADHLAGLFLEVGDESGRRRAEFVGGARMCGELGDTDICAGPRRWVPDQVRNDVVGGWPSNRVVFRGNVNRDPGAPDGELSRAEGSPIMVWDGVAHAPNPIGRPRGACLRSPNTLFVPRLPVRNRTSAGML